MKGFRMQTNSSFQRLGLCLATGLLGCSLAPAVQITTSDTEEPQPHQPEIIVSYGDASAQDGSSLPLLLDQHGLDESGTGGIERFYWQKDDGNDWRIFLDAFALANPDKVGVDLEMQKEETVYFNLNFRQWTDYEFGSGVFYPPNQTFAILSAEALEKEIRKLDLSLRFTPRDSLWVELSYGLFSRDGQSLSTRFGDDYHFSIGGTPSRRIIPALLDSEETVHTVGAKLVREDGFNRTGLRFQYQRRSVDRTHSVERAVAQPSANRFVTQKEESKDDLFALSGFNRTELSDTVTGSIGFAVTRLDGDLTGSRIFGSAPEAAYDLDFATLQLEDRGFLDLENTRRLKQWIFNGNLVYTPSESTRWMTGVRIEHLSTEAFSSYLDTYNRVDWSVREQQREEATMAANSEKSALDISAFLEGRYTGIEHTLFYSRLEVSGQSGDLEESWSRAELVPDLRTPVDLLSRATDFNRSVAFWEVGMNYYPLARLRISLEGYLKVRENSYDWDGVVLPQEDFTLYPAYLKKQRFQTRDVNGRIHYRLTDSLKSVTRVDYQEITIDSENDSNPNIEGAFRRRLVFNQSLVWTPSPKIFFSGTFNYVEDLTDTVAADMEGVFSGIVVNLPNDYWQVDLNLYYVFSKLIDIQFGYQYMEMANYLDTSPTTVPYGSELSQHHGSVLFIFHLSERTKARIGYDYYEYDEPFAGGNRAFQAQLVTGSLQVIF